MECDPSDTPVTMHAKPVRVFHAHVTLFKSHHDGYWLQPQHFGAVCRSVVGVVLQRKEFSGWWVTHTDWDVMKMCQFSTSHQVFALMKQNCFRLLSFAAINHGSSWCFVKAVIALTGGCTLNTL